MFSFCKRWKGSCTCFLDKLFNKDWSECCKQHDEDYINLKDCDSTKPSDEKFLECLKAKLNGTVVISSTVSSTGSNNLYVIT